MITKEQLSRSIGRFTWGFSYYFFIETAIGDFVWEERGNTITQVNYKLVDWVKINEIPFGRDKGSHIIGEYCGDFILVTKNYNRH